MTTLTPRSSPLPEPTGGTRIDWTSSDNRLAVAMLRLLPLQLRLERLHRRRRHHRPAMPKADATMLQASEIGKADPRPANLQTRPLHRYPQPVSSNATPITNRLRMKRLLGTMSTMPVKTVPLLPDFPPCHSWRRIRLLLCKLTTASHSHRRETVRIAPNRARDVIETIATIGMVIMMATATTADPNCSPWTIDIIPD